MSKQSWQINLPFFSKIIFKVHIRESLFDFLRQATVIVKCPCLLELVLCIEHAPLEENSIPTEQKSEGSKIFTL